MARSVDTLVFDELNGPGVHRLENLMTLGGYECAWFDSLKLWFESTDTPNTYMPNSTLPMYQQRIPT